jgi:hypothetical protein
VTGKTRPPAYFAVARTIFDHPLFNYGQPPYSRREAWEWLIAQAAWKPKGHRHVLGITEVQRGQLATTVRELGAIWRWPRSNVHRFLRRLVEEGMVELTRKNKNGTTNSAIRRLSPRWRTIITICNYDRFQAKPRVERRNDGDYERDYDELVLPGIIHEVPAEQEQPTKTNVDSERVGLQGLQPVNFGDNSSTTQWKDKPPHGAKDRKTGKWQWFDHPSSEWTQAARLYTADKGARIFPKKYKGGRGNWFKVRSDAEIKLLYRKICENEGIPRLSSPPGPRLLSRK